MKPLLLIIALCLVGCGPTVKPGQIWVKEYNLDNPFEPIQRDTLVIIKVCGDYCQYKRKGKIYNDRVFWIPPNARLLN